LESFGEDFKSELWGLFGTCHERQHNSRITNDTSLTYFSHTFDVHNNLVTKKLDDPNISNFEDWPVSKK